MARHSSPTKTPRRLLSVVPLIIILTFVVFGASMVVSGRYQVRPVLSGSMRPGLPIGGVVVTKRVPTSSLKVRDVIVFHNPTNPAALVVHRIIQLTPEAGGAVVRTQGDNNDAADPWTVTLRGQTAYKAVFSVPLIGYAAVFVHQSSSRLVLLLLAALLGVGAVVAYIRANRKAASSSEVPPPTVDERSDDSTQIIDIPVGTFDDDVMDSELQTLLDNSRV